MILFPLHSSNLGFEFEKKIASTFPVAYKPFLLEYSLSIWLSWLICRRKPDFLSIPRRKMTGGAKPWLLGRNIASTWNEFSCKYFAYESWRCVSRHIFLKSYSVFVSFRIYYFWKKKWCNRSEFTASPPLF